MGSTRRSILAAAEQANGPIPLDKEVTIAIDASHTQPASDGNVPIDVEIGEQALPALSR